MPRLASVPSSWIGWLNTMSATRLIRFSAICEQEGIDKTDQTAVTRRWRQEVNELRAQLLETETQLAQLKQQHLVLSGRRKRLRVMLGLPPTGRLRPEDTMSLP